MPGYLPYSRKLNVEINHTIAEICELEKGVLLKVEAEKDGNPLKADFFLNGKRRGFTPFSATVPFGTYGLRLSLESFNDITDTIIAGEKPELPLKFTMTHTREYLQGLKELKGGWAELEEKRLAEERKREELAKQRKLKLKQTLKTYKWAARIASGAAVLACGGLSYYYFARANKNAEELKNIQSDYNSSSSEFNAHEWRFRKKKKEAQDYDKMKFIMLGVTAGAGILLGITFTF
jgi:hypothetical protein